LRPLLLATATSRSCARIISARARGAVQFDGTSKARRASGEELKHLMFIGAFGEYCIVQEQQAIAVPPDIPFDRACLIGCGVMTGVGAALNVAHIGHANTVMVIGSLMLDELITQRIRLDAINEAFSALREDKVIRSVITFG